MAGWEEERDGEEEDGFGVLMLSRIGPGRGMAGRGVEDAAEMGGCGTGEARGGCEGAGGAGGVGRGVMSR